MEKKNRKGDLREYIGDVIIGVLCLLLIIFVIVIVYRVFANQETENAKKTIDNLESKINALNEGQGNKFLIQGFNGAENWVIASYNKDEVARPDKCAFSSCICICNMKQRSGPVYYSSERFNICQENGYCRSFSEAKVEAKMSDSLFTRYLPGYENVKENFNFIVLQENLIEIEINKTKDSITLKRVS